MQTECHPYQFRGWKQLDLSGNLGKKSLGHTEGRVAGWGGSHGAFQTPVPESFLRGPPEVTTRNQASYQQMYIWNTGVCEGLLAGQWQSPFIQGRAQDLFKWANKWNSARKSSWTQEQGCLCTNIVRPALGALIYWGRLSQNSWVL